MPEKLRRQVVSLVQRAKKKQREADLALEESDKLQQKAAAIASAYNV